MLFVMKLFRAPRIFILIPVLLVYTMSMEYVFQYILFNHMAVWGRDFCMTLFLFCLPTMEAFIIVCMIRNYYFPKIQKTLSADLQKWGYHTDL